MREARAVRRRTDTHMYISPPGAACIKGVSSSNRAFFLQTFTAQPIQPTTHTNNTWRLPGLLRGQAVGDI